MYLSENLGHRVRILFANGTVATYAGNGKGEAVFQGDYGLATSAVIYGKLLFSMWFDDTYTQQVPKELIWMQVVTSTLRLHRPTL